MFSKVRDNNKVSSSSSLGVRCILAATASEMDLK